MLFLLAHGTRNDNDDLFATADAKLLSVRHHLLRPILKQNKTLIGKPKVSFFRFQCTRM